MKKIPCLIVALLALTACAPGSLPAAATTTSSPSVTEVSVVMGYVPDIQYAPFFIADKKGYFAAEGLKVKYNWGFEFDGIKLVGANQSDFAIVGGDQIIQARAQTIPIVYVANWYHDFPVEIISLADKQIREPKDLIGKKVGLPGLFGATYTAWRAMLYTQHIDPATITVRDIGFTQAQALTQGTVDAVSAYANNEPVQLKLAGKSINEIKTWEFAQLVGNGVATNEATVRNKPQLVRGFVKALLRGVADSIANPDEALQISVAALPEAGGDNLKKSQAVLNASIPLWKNSRLGESRPADWEAMEKFMSEAGMIQKRVDVSQAYTNQFVP